MKCSICDPSLRIMKNKQMRPAHKESEQKDLSVFAGSHQAPEQIQIQIRLLTDISRLL